MRRRRPSVFQRFLNDPSSFRYAAGAIIAAVIATVVLGAIVMRIFDPDEFGSFGEALWFTLQTATTVGYGDRVPEDVVGRIVASVVMLVSFGVVTVATAVVTSLFVQSARASRAADIPAVEETPDAAEDPAAAIARLEAALASMREQLDRIERAGGSASPITGGS